MMDFAKLVVTGADARNFLNGQLTADMDHLDYLYDHPENSGLGGLCNIKGRLEAVFWIQKIENGFDLYLPKCISEGIATLLKRYVFRSKVTIEVVDANEEFTTIVPQDFNIPWIIEATQGKYVPQMVSLDVLKGVHPRKGCYIGQEIVTRLRDLGKNKKRLGKISLGQNDNINKVPINYCRYIRFVDNIQYVNIVNSQTASTNQLLKNIEIRDIVGTSNSRVNITADRNLDYTTFVQKNSSGEIKQFCLADLIQ